MTRRILLVEDDPDNRELTRDLLEEAGYDVVVAENGLAALARLRDAPGVGLILLDLRMPDMDGFEFRAHQLKDETFARIPVIVCTAEARGEQLVEQLGLAATIRKPFQVDRLLEMIGRHMQEC